MLAATSSTVRPGDHVGGQTAIVASRSASTMEKLAPGFWTSAAVITHSPSGSMRRVRSRVSRRDSGEVQVTSPGDAVAATLARQVAAES